MSAHRVHVDMNGFEELPPVGLGNGGGRLRSSFECQYRLVLHVGIYRGPAARLKTRHVVALVDKKLFHCHSNYWQAAIYQLHSMANRCVDIRS